MDEISPINVKAFPISPISPISPILDSTPVWSRANAVVFVIFLSLFLFSLITGASFANEIADIKNNWGAHRCSPMVMPFAALFGHDAKENFNFCMGDIFNTHSQPMMNSTSSMFGSFTGLLGKLFGSINTMRGTITTLGGGISGIIKDFTDRISMFFFRIRISAITIKTLISRMYAILFSVMYMGLSGITSMASFTNTTLFSFLDTFCFPGDTELDTLRGKMKIKDIKIGDVLLPTNSKVTATFRFYAKGQPMVTIGNTTVSTNHYIIYKDKPIKAMLHPDAVKTEECSDLYCLNTHDNHIPIDGQIYLDYDETATADKETMNYIEGRVNGRSLNGSSLNKSYPFTEYCPAIDEYTYVKTVEGRKLAKNIKIGDKLITGSEVVGLIRRVVKETSVVNNISLTPSTLYWNDHSNEWSRIGDTFEIKKEAKEMVSFIVVPNSQIELDGLRIRDYMELCSPDSELYYSKKLERLWKN